MSDRWIFLVSFLTVVLIVAGAFAVVPLFYFELVKSAMYFAIAVMVFYGEDKYSYMLGIVAPPLWFILDILLGGFFADLGVLRDYLAGKGVPPMDTPLHGIALLTQALLVVLSARAWKKQVSAPWLGKTFGICLGVSVVYCAVLTGWYWYGFASIGRMP